MRLWSLHPKYLDSSGLVAVWREALLAQSVLKGKTKGYVHHPQLERFRQSSSPLGSVGSYLEEIFRESFKRGYSFNVSKITQKRACGYIPVAEDQIRFEFKHLMNKLKVRNPEWMSDIKHIKDPEPHPLFSIVKGGIEAWEKGDNS